MGFFDIFVENNEKNKNDKNDEKKKENIIKDQSGELFDETAVNLATAIKNCINPENNRNYSRNISNVKKKYSWSRFVKKINIS